MNMAQTIALLGAGTAGFMRGKNETEDRADAKKRRDEDEAFQNEQRARQRQDWSDQDAERAALRDANLPTVVQTTGGLPDTMDNIDVGQPGEPAVSPQVSTVRGKTFVDDSGAAARYAAEQDTPTARTMRMADVIGVRNPVAAQSVRAGARADQLGQLQLDDAERAHLNKMFDDGLAGLSDPQQMADYVSNSPIGGKTLKVKAVPSADGSTFAFHKVDESGKTTPVTGQFENTPSGMLLAKQLLSRVTPDNMKIQALQEDRKLKIEQQKADTDQAYKEGLIGVKEDANGNKANGLVARMSEADRIAFTDINKQLELINTERTKSQLGGMWKDEDPGVRAVQKKEVALTMQRNEILKRYRGAGEGASDPLNLLAPSAPASDARQPTSMELILDDMKKTGVKGADVRLDGQPAMRVGEAAPAPPPSAPEATPGATPAQDAAGAQLDAARGRLAVANAAMKKWGLRQRQQSPMGFNAALAEVQNAEEAAAAAQSAYQATVGQISASFRYPKP